MLRVIQVGVGGFGGCWLDTITKYPEAQHVALVDVNKETLAAAAEKVGVSADACFTDLDEALANVEADAVVCVTPPALHREVCVKALEAGKNVITEKPLADTLENCKAMVEAAQRTGKVLMVSQNYRFVRWARTVRKLIDSEVVGKPEVCVLRFYKDPQFSGFRAEMPYPLIIDMSIHHFDLIRYLTGSDAVEVSGTSWNPSWSVFQGDPSSLLYFKMANGMHVVYDATWASRGRQTDWPGDWQIECQHGAITFDGKIHVTTADGETREVTELEPMPHEGQAFTLSNFIEAVSRNEQPETCAADNIGSVSMVFGAVEAVKSGSRVKL